ncbi:hypothetical protein FQZ97_1151180 [compost metagenome]
MRVGRAAEQAGLDHARRQVGGQGFELRLQQLGRHGLHLGHGGGALRGDGGHDGAEVHAKRVGRTLVGRQARAATAVGTGDAPDHRGHGQLIRKG